MMDNGMTWMMAIACLLVVAVLVLAAAALIRYLRSGRRVEPAALPHRVDDRDAP